MKRVLAGVLLVSTALVLAGCATDSPTAGALQSGSDGPTLTSELPTVTYESLAPAAPAEPAFSGSEPSHVGPSEQKVAGELTFWITKYFDKYPDDSDRYFYLYFCPSDGATATAWTMARPGAIALKSTSGEDLRIVALSQVDGSYPAMVDSQAESGTPVPTSSCASPQGWGVFFSDSQNSADPALSMLIVTTDSGASVTFGAEDIPAFNQ